MFKTYKEFIIYMMAELGSGCYVVNYTRGEREVWLYDARFNRVKIVYANYGAISADITVSYEFVPFSAFSFEFFKDIKNIEEV